MVPPFLRPEVLPYASIVVIPAGAVVCAWCPDFAPSTGVASHGMCPACQVLFNAAIDADRGIA